MRPIFLKKIPWHFSPLETYRAFKPDAPKVLLESARYSSSMGRYSIAAQNPFLVFESTGREITLKSKKGVKKFTGNPFFHLKRLLKRFQKEPVRGSPPFTGGAVGYASYECHHWLEPCLSGRADETGPPDLQFLFFDEGILWDHQEKDVYCFSPSREGPRLRPAIPTDQKTAYPKWESIRSSLSRGDFVHRVQKAQEYIRAGDIFQANLSQRLSFAIDQSAVRVYEALKESNPSSFFGIFDAGSFQIISGSPERLLKLENGLLETRPIAGTRPRGANRSADEKASLDLLLSEKERAEHLMLVDLERNDMGRVAEYGSVVVDELMSVENYSRVKHLVSNVRGVLRKNLDAVDAFCAFFPGGTITGAPKIRSMQIIRELEPVARGPYTGSLGYFSFTGNMDFNIIIRSLVIKNKKATLHAGAGIVADSLPQKEYDETLYKAEGVLAAVFGKEKTRLFLEHCGVRRPGRYAELRRS